VPIRSLVLRHPLCQHLQDAESDILSLPLHAQLRELFLETKMLPEVPRINQNNDEPQMATTALTTWRHLINAPVAWGCRRYFAISPAPSG